MRTPARLRDRVCILVLLLAFLNGAHAAAQEPPRPADPVGALAAILDAFETHDVVAVADPHGNVQTHEFRLSLIHDPRFAPTVDDIVVEWGNALYQDVIDRYVNGAEVADQELRLVWQNTTQRRPGAPSDQPTTADFFLNVREINAALPPERRLRVLLGDPPIDWDKIETPADTQAWIDLRDIHPAELIRREVLDRQRRALVVYGGMHLQRRNLFSNYELVDDRRVHTLVQQLEREHDARVFTVWVNTTMVDLRTIQADVASWPVPSLAMVRDTALGAASFAEYYTADVPRATMQAGEIVPIPRDEWRALPMEEQFDAVLHLGPPSAMTR